MGVRRRVTRDQRVVAELPFVVLTPALKALAQGASVLGSATKRELGGRLDQSDLPGAQGVRERVATQLRLLSNLARRVEPHTPDSAVAQYGAEVAVAGGDSNRVGNTFELDRKVWVIGY